MKRILALFALLCAVAATPASAAWTYDGNDGNNIWATDGTWRIKFIKNGSTYYVGGWEDGGATLDLSTVYEDLAAEATPHVVPFSDIGNQCFQNNKVIETLILPARITSIGNNAFNGCTALRTATMPGVTKVNQGTFSGCTSLVTVDCPKLKNIASYGAFQGCTSLVELKVAADMTSFSSDTFRGCTSFTTLYERRDEGRRTRSAATGRHVPQQLQLPEHEDHARFRAVRDVHLGQWQHLRRLYAFEGGPSPVVEERHGRCRVQRMHGPADRRDFFRAFGDARSQYVQRLHEPRVGLPERE